MEKEIGYSILIKALKLKILPVVIFENANDALSVAEAFIAGGLKVMEVPLRTDDALKAITAIRKKFPDMNVGAGTILTKKDLKKAIGAGAQFGLAPGLNQIVCKEAAKKSFPFIPGVMTPSEIELGIEMGMLVQKLFPIEQLGGISYLKALQGPYEKTGVKFIPMGGIAEANLQNYLTQKNVMAVGGSWLASKEMISKKNFKLIKEKTADALKIASQLSK